MTNIRNADVTVASDQKEAYTSFIDGLDWTFWATGTTSYELTLPSARRLIERYADILRRELHTEVRIFWVAEPHDVKDGHHLHFLIYMRREFPYSYLYKLWQVAVHGKRGGWSRVSMERYRPSKGASGYCSKYINKAKADYDIIL